MNKLLLGIVTVCAVGTALAFDLDTNVWTGNGGDFRWANMANWEKKGGGDPVAPGEATAVIAPCWDFSTLPADATITNDYDSSKVLYMGGLTFGANQGTITFVSVNGAQCNFVKSNVEPWINPIVSIPTGTTVDFRAKFVGGWIQSSVYFRNGGIFKVNGEFSHDTVLRLFIEDITFVVGADWPAASKASFAYVLLNSDKSVFKMEQDRMLGYVMTKVGLSGKPKMYLDGYALTMRVPSVKDGYGITNSAEIVTGGTLAMRYNYAHLFSGGFAADCTPMTFSMDNADVDVGSAANPIALPVGSRYLGNRNGRLGLFADSSFASLSSATPAGGLSIAADKTVTVTGTADVSEELKSPVTGGGKLKVAAPASYELKLTGANDCAQGLRVESGKVSTSRPYRDADGLVAYWNFDNDATGTDPRSLRPGRIIETSTLWPTTRTSFDTAGVGGSGKCAHFDYTVAEDGVRNSIVAKVKGVQDERLLAMTNDHTVVLYLRPDPSTMDLAVAPLRADADPGTVPIMEVFYNCWAESNLGRGMCWVCFRGTNDVMISGIKEDLTGGVEIAPSAYGVDFFDGNWHQLAVSYDSATRTHRVYFDGSNVYARVRSTDYHFLLAEDARFGTRVTHNADKHRTFHGDMDNLQLWSRTLSASELADDWRRLGNLPGQSAFGKTAPIAHWKFDDASDIGKDSSGNGHPLTVVKGDGYGVVTKTDAVCPGVNGLAAQVPTLNNKMGSHLVCDLSTVLTNFSSYSFTMRIQQIGSVAENLNAAIFLGSPTASQFLQVHAKNWIPYLELTAHGWVYNSDAAHQIGVSLAGNAKAARSGWMDFAFVYDSVNKTYRIYRDGILINTWTTYPNNGSAGFGSEPKLYVGYDPMKNGWFPEYVDDIRLYDRALTEGEVKEVVRELSNAGKASDDVLPTTSEPAVVGTGVLELGANQTLRKLWGSGNGTLSLPWADLTLTENSEFGGVLSGRGTIRAQKSLTLGGSGPNFVGKVVANGVITANGNFPNTTFAYAEGAQLTVAGNEGPLIQSGTIEIPSTGTLTVTGSTYPADRRIVIARGTKVTAPDGIAGWTANLPACERGRFYLKATEFGFKVGSGTVILLK